MHARLAIYKRLAHAADEDDLIQIQEELIDRFGKLPDAAQTLLTTHRLRLAAQPLGIVKIDASETQALLQFGPRRRWIPPASSSWSNASATSSWRARTSCASRSRRSRSRRAPTPCVRCCAR